MQDALDPFISPPKWLFNTATILTSLALLYSQTDLNAALGLRLSLLLMALAVGWLVRLIMVGIAFCFSRPHYPQMGRGWPAWFLLPLCYYGTTELMEQQAPLQWAFRASEAQMNQLAQTASTAKTGTTFPDQKLGRFQAKNIRKNGPSLYLDFAEDYTWNYKTYGFAYTSNGRIPTTLPDANKSLSNATRLSDHWFLTVALDLNRGSE